jgi:hypothetical protein
MLPRFVPAIQQCGPVSSETETSSMTCGPVTRENLKAIVSVQKKEKFLWIFSPLFLRLIWVPNRAAGRSLLAYAS